MAEKKVRPSTTYLQEIQTEMSFHLSLFCRGGCLGSLDWVRDRMNDHISSLAKKLGVCDPETIAKANEYYRLMTLKVPQNALRKVITT